jgi:hypothetical protein
MKRKREEINETCEISDENKENKRSKTNNKTNNETKKCSSCKEYYGTLEKNYQCSQCYNKKKMEVDYEIVDSDQEMKVYNKVCQSCNKLGGFSEMGYKCTECFFSSNISNLNEIKLINTKEFIEKNFSKLFYIYSENNNFLFTILKNNQFKILYQYLKDKTPKETFAVLNGWRSLECGFGRIILESKQADKLFEYQYMNSKLEKNLKHLHVHSIFSSVLDIWNIDSKQNNSIECYKKEIKTPTSSLQELFLHFNTLASGSKYIKYFTPISIGDCDICKERLIYEIECENSNETIFQCNNCKCTNHLICLKSLKKCPNCNINDNFIKFK